ncbi:TonB-dependent receptor [Polaribacter sp. IC066]|uniref:TonB-dependent receptor domain-containing protein n=1 Tax=Polaribacter sp. IC066 TaxID=57032 RepID=UPI0011BDD748|nr:TonB-dependent receptor [Polaribacter sp. IC066]TXD57601.1 TonB-dependent receptor [Polaribacter sp. IC066]
MKTIFSVLICALIYTASFSQEKKGTKKDSLKRVPLDEVIITGKLKTDPIHTMVSNTYDKKVVQPKNVADLFNNINGFSVIKRGNYAIDPTFRGNHYEQLNIQYDGGTKAMHACPNRMDPITTHIIPEEVSKIEIIKGPYTVRYGATFGGIVNLVTKKPNYFENGLHGKFSSGYETNGNSFVNMAQLQYIKDKYDVVGNFGYRNFGNYEDGDGAEIPSSFSSTDYGVKMGYNFKDNERLQFHWRQSFGRDVLHAGLPMDTEYDNSSIASLDYKKSNLKGTLKSISGKAYYSFVDHLMTNIKRPSFLMTEASSAVNATTAGGKVELNWQPSNNLDIFTGVDALLINRDGARMRLVKVINGALLPTPEEFNDKVWQNSYVNDFGVFTEVKWFMKEKTLFTAGIRYDMVIADILDPDADFAAMYNLSQRIENNISGTVSLKKVVSNKLTFEAAFGRGVRSANMIERYISHFNVGQDPYEYIGNPNLKAEVNNQFEIGFTANNNKKSIKYAASIYYSDLKNFIVGIVDSTKTRKFMPAVEPVNPKVFRNLNNAYRTGFEASFETNITEDYYIKSQMSYVYARNKDLDESLPLTPPFNAKVILGVNKPTYWANLQYNSTSTQNEIAPSFGETNTEGYQTIDLRFGFKPFKNANLGFAAINIFDKTYNNHLNFSFTNQADFGRVPINEPGRNMTAFFQYTF